MPYKNKEKQKEYIRSYLRKHWRKYANVEKSRIIHKNMRRKLREEVFSHYGGKCVCCGEPTNAFLTIDHSNNDGNKHRKEIVGRSLKQTSGSGYKFYGWLKKNNYPEKYKLQLLCFNCNCGRNLNGGICPHKQ